MKLSAHNDGMGKTIRLDTVAGLTAAAVVLPKAMAYATGAGLPVEVGLYTAFLPMAIYALLGSSRVLSVSSTATIAILVATQSGVFSEELYDSWKDWFASVAMNSPGFVWPMVRDSQAWSKSFVQEVDESLVSQDQPDP